MDGYKICILAAGAGTRMGELSQHLHKTILPVNFKATISYIIEKFPAHLEIVVAIGHKKDTIVDYLALAHPDRKFTFVRIADYVGPGTGPGYSLLQCRNELKCPFILVTGDTIVLENIPEPDKNWFGVSAVNSPEEYCTVKIKNNLVCQIDDKVKCNNKFAWIGLAGIYDFQTFFSAIETNKDQIAGEIQTSNGFKSLIEKQLSVINFTWFDTGTLEKYQVVNKMFSGEQLRFDFSKKDEFLYFINDKVIKYYSNPDIVQKRYARSKLLKDICPPIKAIQGGFYVYKKVDGQVFYNVLNNRLLDNFLSWAQKYLWSLKPLITVQNSQFVDACRRFYFDKTHERIKDFYDKTGLIDTTHNINGVNIPPLSELLSHIDWDYLCQGVPTTIHGDLQFDNILVTDEKDNFKNQFVLLDWRQDFGGLIETGDLYYDLSKLYGGILISYALIKEGMFSFDMSGKEVFYKYYIKNDLLEAKDTYEEFLRKNNFDFLKVRFITSLIFLNMAALHKSDFNYLLYFLGKKMLFSVLTNSKMELEAFKKL